MFVPKANTFSFLTNPCRNTKSKANVVGRPLVIELHVFPPSVVWQTVSFKSTGILLSSLCAGITHAWSGLSSSMANAKPYFGNPCPSGRWVFFPLTSSQVSPPSTVLKMPQWFCCQITFGVDVQSNKWCGASAICHMGLL